MRKDGVTFSKSSFLGMAKDTSLIMNRILSNKKLLKLIYHTSRNWEKEPDLNSEQIKSLFDNKQMVSFEATENGNYTITLIRNYYSSSNQNINYALSYSIQ